jgi:oligopeptide transport system substrate-binding protein
MRYIAPFFMLTIALAGCGGTKGGASTSAKHDHVLVQPIPNNPTKLDPAQVEDGDTIEVLNQVFEGLAEYDENNKLVPLLAEKWEVSDDGLTYTIHLKKGVKFHSGREMTADDVKYSWDRAANPAVVSPTAEGYMADIVGFAEEWAGKATSLSGVKVLDPETIEVKIKSPKAFWPMYLTYACYWVVDKDHAKLEPITDIASMVGTGPFKMSEYKGDQYIEMTRFDDYHGGKPKLEKIRRLIAGDAQVRRQLFESGQADWVALERQDKRFVDSNPELKAQLHTVDRAAIWYIGFGLSQYEPFKNPKVRQAFALAINKDRIIQEGFDGVNRKAEGIMPPVIPGFDENFKGYQYNPAEAQKLLAEAGYPGGKGLDTIKLYFRADRADPKIVSQMVQQDLQKNLGVSVELAPMEWKALLEKRSKGELPFFHLRWGADYLDPQNFLTFMLHTHAKENTLGYSNPQFDALCEKADAMPLAAADQRYALYRQAESIAVRDAIWIPIYFQRDLELQSPAMSGLRRSAMGPLPHTTTDVVHKRP